MDINFTLKTEGDRSDGSYFGFTGYLQTAAGEWKWIVLDLTKLELGAEGERAYVAAGEPERPMTLSQLMLVTRAANRFLGSAYGLEDLAAWDPLWLEVLQALSSSLRAGGLL